ncbi:MAG: nuclear transport factor 2 family protein [Steroidobacteraceae bacterium]|nr:nuclear transport factor 2 family protein [Steroidobacteraceae bacterium]
MKHSITSVICIAAVVFASQVAVAGEDPKVAAEVMAITRAQWAADMQGKSMSEQTANLADDYTEFNPGFPVRIDGKAMNASIYEAQNRSGDKTLLGEMVNPKVQVYGDVAILTYNYVGVTQAKDGKTDNSLAKSTRVYAKIGGQWKLVHANFAPVESPQN